MVIEYTKAKIKEEKCFVKGPKECEVLRMMKLPNCLLAAQ